jgi:hypothetical protein
MDTIRYLQTPWAYPWGLPLGLTLGSPYPLRVHRD